MGAQETERETRLDADLGVDELRLIFSSADENAEMDPEEFGRRVRRAFVEHPDTEETERGPDDPSWGAVSWFADRTGMHFSSASRKMNGDLRLKVRDVLYLEAIEREAGLDE